MIYRGPGFLAVVGFCSSPTASILSHQQVVSLSQSSCVRASWRGVRGRGRSQIIRRRESPVLYKTCNTLWMDQCIAAAPRAYFGCALDLQGALAEVGVLNAQAQLSVPKYQQESIYFTTPPKRSFRVCKKEKSEGLFCIKKAEEGCLGSF